MSASWMVSPGLVGALVMFSSGRTVVAADETAKVKSVVVNLNMGPRTFQLGFSDPDKVALLVTKPLAESKTDDSKTRHMTLGYMANTMSDGKTLYYTLFQPLGYYLSPERQHRVADFSALKKEIAAALKSVADALE